jgi:hypothetical protein
MMQQPPTPTAAAYEEARQQRGGYVYAIDGVVDPNGAVPPERIAGAWPVDSEGNLLVDQWQPNPNYRPLRDSEA